MGFAYETGETLLRRFDALERRREYARLEVIARRLERLTQTASGFFRGAPSLFFELLRTHPSAKELLGKDRRWIVGDVHMENIGVIAIGHGKLVWDFNDLDEACIQSPLLDVLRGAASAAVGAIDLGYGTSAAIRAAEAFIVAYLRPLAETEPRVVKDLVARAEARTVTEMLDERCPEKKGRRRFVIDKRYLALTPAEWAVVEDLFERYAKDNPLDVPKALRLQHAAFRVQGTGSLGVSRFIMLVSVGKKGERLLIEAKEMRKSAVERGGMVKTRAPRVGEAGRVHDAMHALLAAPQEGVRAIKGKDRRSYLVRKHAPGEDKLVITALRDQDELVALARTIGFRLSRAHVRAASLPTPAFDPSLALSVAFDLALAMVRAHLALAVRASVKSGTVKA
jgi:uncharacterized protein (DUF2252 family)